ncbi:metallophosphoesterase [Parablastomonas sp. CN1-191]|uniref:metallophosphoesterase n=1 Tax=Parablastomonas sp. CN1-191 TaxID=3400908 RepID=UPI003BF77461
MLSRFTRLIRPAAPEALPAIPPGERIYAIGDVHGCADQFAAMVDAVEADDTARGAARTTVILLGDLIDRGPDSAAVVRMAREWAARRSVRHIAGNHEEMFLESFDKGDVLRHFLRYGGRETLLSYPIDPEAYRVADIAETQALMTAAVPAADREYLSAAEDLIRIGDYVFVHAGVKPDVPLEEQKRRDLRWIREPFLSHRGAHAGVVVHGHTISDAVEVRPNRIGIDTGAYGGGPLTALGLEGNERWLIEATLGEGGASTSLRTL